MDRLEAGTETTALPSHRTDVARCPDAGLTPGSMSHQRAKRSAVPRVSSACAGSSCQSISWCRLIELRPSAIGGSQTSGIVEYSAA